MGAIATGPISKGLALPHNSAAALTESSRKTRKGRTVQLQVRAVFFLSAAVPTELPKPTLRVQTASKISRHFFTWETLSQTPKKTTTKTKTKTKTWLTSQSPKRTNYPRRGIEEEGGVTHYAAARWSQLHSFKILMKLLISLLSQRSFMYRKVCLL